MLLRQRRLIPPRDYCRWQYTPRCQHKATLRPPFFARLYAAFADAERQRRLAASDTRLPLPPRFFTMCAVAAADIAAYADAAVDAADAFSRYAVAAMPFMPVRCYAAPALFFFFAVTPYAIAPPARR